MKGLYINERANSTAQDDKSHSLFIYLLLSGGYHLIVGFLAGRKVEKNGFWRVNIVTIFRVAHNDSVTRHNAVRFLCQ